MATSISADSGIRVFEFRVESAQLRVPAAYVVQPLHNFIRERLAADPAIGPARAGALVYGGFH